MKAWTYAAAILVAAVSLAASGQTTQNQLAPVNAALQAGEADKALALLQSLSLSGPAQAEADNLECRVRYTLEQWDAAVHACQQAVSLDGQNSNYRWWLARALGEKADRASFLSAYSLAKQVRAQFEEAVRLNPRNSSALADLGEFYEDAPGVVGGGISKAEAIAGQLDKVDPVQAHELRGRVAQGNKDYGTAEREFKQALSSSTHPAFQWVTLASFYRARQRWPEMESAVHSCVSAAARDKHAGVALYDGASVLIRAKRDPELAAKMLQDYLAGSSKTEEAPAFIAHIRLARLEQKLGDASAAQREQSEAMALAHEYKPPQESRN